MPATIRAFDTVAAQQIFWRTDDPFSVDAGYPGPNVDYPNDFADLTDIVIVSNSPAGGGGVGGGPITTDSIEEETPGNGVEVDGMRIKDGLLSGPTKNERSRAEIDGGATTNDDEGQTVATYELPANATILIAAHWLGRDAVSGDRVRFSRLIEFQTDGSQAIDQVLTPTIDDRVDGTTLGADLFVTTAGSLIVTFSAIGVAGRAIKWAFWADVVQVAADPGPIG